MSSENFKIAEYLVKMCPIIRYISFHYCDLDILEYILKNISLRSLQISNSKTLEFLFSLNMVFPTIRCLTITSDFKKTTYMPRMFPRLKKLNVYDNTYMGQIILPPAEKITIGKWCASWKISVNDVRVLSISFFDEENLDSFFKLKFPNLTNLHILGLWRNSNLPKLLEITPNVLQFDCENGKLQITPEIRIKVQDGINIDSHFMK